MSKALAAAAISAMTLIGIATPALAQSSDFADRRIEELLRQLVTKQAREADPVLVNRAANIKVTGTIKRASQFHLPIACNVRISDGESHIEEKSATVAFAGTVGTCTVDIPFKWTNTDKDGTVDVNVIVGNGALDFLTTQATTANDIFRSSVLTLPDIPLPLQGSTTTLSFDIRM